MRFAQSYILYGKLYCTVSKCIQLERLRTRLGVKVRYENIYIYINTIKFAQSALYTYGVCVCVYVGKRLDL